MDILAALASDPTVLPLWAVLVFAAGMYPVGMIFSCRACCRCSACTVGELPQTVTVTFDGFVDEEQIPGPDLIGLSATACFGGGFAGKVTAPGGDPATDAGPIAAFEITNAGNGYAAPGRVEPTITIGGGSGTGADLEVTLSENLDGCGISTWDIASVAIASGGDGGTGYVDGEQLTATVTAPGVEAGPASLTCQTTRSEPTLTAVVLGGDGATFTITLAEEEEYYTGKPYWAVSAVSVDSGGTGYSDGAEMTFTLGPDGVASSEASVFVRTQRSAPTVELEGGTGTAADLAVTLSANAGPPETWSISSITITDGGSGYVEGDLLSVTLGTGDAEEWGANVSVTAVDGSGAITALSINEGGGFFHDDGIVESVDINFSGAYWDDDGVIVSVSVDNGGNYYEEDWDAPPYVADVTVVISQTAPSAGAGAVLSATVDDDTSSPTFGQITAIAIDTAGDDYLAWEWVTNWQGCCGDHYNGKTVVARRGLDGNNCQFVHYFCGTGAMYARHGRVVVNYPGPAGIPSVGLLSEWYPSENPSVTCDTSYQADAPVEDCDAFEFVATSNAGETASVVPGGDYDEADGNPDYAANGFPSCSICCRGTSQAPREITVSVVDNRPGGGLAGNYVLEAELVSPYTSAGVTTAGYVRWAYYGEPDEFGNQPGVLIQLWLDSVAGQTRTSYIAGDDCHRCYIGGAAGGYNVLLGDYEYAGPICAPSGAYDLRQGPGGNNFVGLTITVL